MPTLSGLTLTQLRAATVAQIRTAMTTRLGLMTKRQLCILDLWCREFDPDALMTIDDDAVITTRPDRQVASQTTVQRDVLGVKTGSRAVAWSYYASGIVKDIMITDRDAADAQVAKRVIHHYEDGSQPTVVTP